MKAPSSWRRYTQPVPGTLAVNVECQLIVVPPASVGLSVITAL